MADNEHCETLLQIMVDRIVAAVQPETIILFGSRARGQHRPDSDVDLLIIEPEPFDVGRSRRRATSLVRHSLAEFLMPKDILVYSREEVDRWKHTRNHILARCLREGKVLYERP